MTGARHRRKSRIHAALLAVGLGLGLGAPPAVAGPGTERIVIDRRTGLALYGYDPVAYFTDGQAAPGLDTFEHRHAGVIWHFRNPGNRSAFAADPEVYMPRFGGYDPLAVARGVAVPGHPDFWVLIRNRLFLFANGDSRKVFLSDPDRAAAAAEAAWPRVSERLLP